MSTFRLVFSSSTKCPKCTLTTLHLHKRLSTVLANKCVRTIKIIKLIWITELIYLESPSGFGSDSTKFRYLNQATLDIQIYGWLDHNSSEPNQAGYLWYSLKILNNYLGPKVMISIISKLNIHTIKSNHFCRSPSR